MRDKLDVDGMRSALRAQLAELNSEAYRARRSPEAQRRLDFATKLLEVKSRGELLGLIAATKASVGRRQQIGPVDVSKNRISVTTLSVGGSDLLRLTATHKEVTRSERSPLVSADEEPCDAYPPSTPEEDLPAHCVDGYDPYYDPSGDEAEVASMESESAAMEYEVNNSGEEFLDMVQSLQSLLSPEGDEPTAGLTVGELISNPLVIFECEGERAEFWASVGGFAVMAGRTIFWAWRKNPSRAWSNLQGAAVALVAVNVTYTTWEACRAS